MAWSPITEAELLHQIAESVKRMDSEIARFWKASKIKPEQWHEAEYGREFGFWAVAILGRHVVWYNDIEGGFNVSRFSTYGTIDEYECEQLDLHHLLFHFIHYWLPK